MTDRFPDPAGPPEGGRDNGLSAAYFVPLRDVEPHLAPALLDALREAAIAAYVTPSAGTRGAYGDVHLPSSPVERLWVDGRLRRDADLVVSTVLADAAPSSTEQAAADPATDGSAGGDAALPVRDTAEADERAVFDAIVASFHDEPAGGRGGWPSAEDVGTGLAGGRGGRRFAARLDRAPGGLDAGMGGAVEDAEGDSPDDGLPDHVRAVLDDHFVPEPPPPLPRPRLATALAMLAVIGGLAAIIADPVMGLGLDNATLLIATLCVLGGFAALVMRLRDGRDDDDDGAVV